MAAPGITLDDVREAIAAMGRTPETTNAGAIRAAKLGTGSLSTIQRHLVALRTPPAPAAIAVPEPPKDVLASLWSTAVAAAGVDLGVRIERLTVERDRLAGDLALARADADAALSAADEAVEAAAQSEAARIAAEADAHDLQMTIVARDQELVEVRERERQALAASEQQSVDRLSQVQHEHALQLMELRSGLDRAGEREGVLRAETVRLHEQVGRLQAELEACRRNAQ